MTLRGRLRDVFVAGTLAGLAMIPFAAAFRARGLRVNEYGRKTLELLVGEVGAPLDLLLGFAQHLVISWLAAVPLLVVFARRALKRMQIVAARESALRSPPVCG